jgi:hypothetical protein
MAKQTEPRKVTKVPEGYVPEDRNGKTVYVKRSERARQSSGSTINKIKAPVVKKATTGTPTKSITRTTVRRPESSFDEDVVILDEPAPVVPITPEVQKQQSLRTDAKEIFTGGLPKGIHQYQVPDLTTGGNYAKQKNVFTDEEGNPVSFDFKTNQYVKTGEPNFRSTMPVQNDTPTIQEPLKENQLPTKFDAVPERLRAPIYNAPKITTPTVDTTTYKGFNEPVKPVENISDEEFKIQQSKNLAIPKLKKGGLVDSIKGYYNGGGVRGDKNNDGIVGADEQTDLARKDKLTNAVGGGFGAAGTAYYNTQTPTNNSDAVRNTGMATVSQMGPIGGVIGGVAGLGDKIGKPIKARSERLDAQGNLIDADKSKMNAIGGGLLSPTKALSYRAETGNWTDITGKDYNKSIEDKAKRNLARVEKANTLSKIDQAKFARDNNNFAPTIDTPYDLSGASFDENQNLILKNQQFKKGGLVNKMQSCAKGGEIKGKGTGTSDSIKAKIKPGSFIVPAKNAKVAEVLREEVLDKSPKAKADLNQKGGADVRLSNNEHLFSPEEVEILTIAGIDLNKLAPHAQSALSKWR